MTITHPPESHALNLRVGEILATLDENGELDNLPFMPEMLQSCGRRSTVDKLAVKLCDAITWTRMRRMQHAVHLQGLRCDGQEPVQHVRSPEDPKLCTRSRLIAATRSGTASSSTSDETFSCQATELLRAAPERVPSWDARQYLLDVRSGNARALATIRTLFIGLFNEYQNLSRRFLTRRLLMRGGRRYPSIEGKLAKTPEQTLGRQPGELVRIRTKDEIVRTLDTRTHNRGMSFDAKTLKYCGWQARVLRRAERIIDEPSGTMIEFKNPALSWRT
jgi:hypothetical protein